MVVYTKQQGIALIAFAMVAHFQVQSHQKRWFMLFSVDILILT